VIKISKFGLGLDLPPPQSVPNVFYDTEDEVQNVTGAVVGEDD
jgi:hypothetical protein